MKVRNTIGAGMGVLFAFLAPLLASAHEVYVLSSSEIQQGLSTPAFSSLGEILGNLNQFLFWAFIGVLLVFMVFFVSISRFLEQRLDPLLMKLKKYASMVARVTIGLSFLAAAYYQALFGPEIPLTTLFGSFAPVVTVALVLLGLMLCFNIFSRIAALVAMVFFGIAVARYGLYMLTYTNYFGELLIVLLFTNTTSSYSGKLGIFWKGIQEKCSVYRFFILRIAFGISLLYASLYAKFIHNDLALQVAALPLAGHMHSLASVLGFEPHFLVLGAGIVEIVIGMFFLLGIEIRFTALFLEFWLTLSLLYFGEVVWPHLILIGIPIAFLLHGYDKSSLEGLFFKKKDKEPVF